MKVTELSWYFWRVDYREIAEIRDLGVESRGSIKKNKSRYVRFGDHLFAVAKVVTIWENLQTEHANLWPAIYTEPKLFVVQGGEGVTQGNSAGREGLSVNSKTELREQ